MITELRLQIRDAARPFAVKYGFTVLPELADIVVISWLFFTVLQVSLSPPICKALFPVWYGKADKRTRRNWYPPFAPGPHHGLIPPQGRAPRVTRACPRRRRACFTVPPHQKSQR